MSRLILHEDRFFDPDPSRRIMAREIFEFVENLPIVAPHGHVDPKMIAENTPFPNPTELLIIPDHYIFRMLYSQGYSMESLGVPTVDGSKVETDPRKIWNIFASNYYLFDGTPSGVWMNYELAKVFEIQEKPNSENADLIYDQISEKIKDPGFLPQNLFEKFNIELLTTTDAATDDLKYHKSLKDSKWEGRMIPCFRPDAVTDLSVSGWKNNLKLLEERVGFEIGDYKTFIAALENRREFFINMGATATDHGVFSPYTHELTEAEADAIFQRALNGKTTAEDASLFTANILMEMARMSTEDGLVMQIHAGSFRNHNQKVFEKFGLDKGCDIPYQVDFTFNLRELLNKYGNNNDLTIILFTLDETTYSRELAPLVGHYPALKVGPAWWFHDSIQGMTRYREMITETAGFYNTVGFNDDTRAFLSIPARHDLARRIDSNFLAGLVASHIISLEEAKKIAFNLAYGLVIKNYKL
ncbi:MAG: glucuronate isomerase [Melioribacteraceae bacterium]|nr:glucuronate isomerase [Melioribacteraceae bacterium]MCF8265709.1 glucuronate isomerase [Melioribacteraceae bacterium]MCF8432174.1 glucuronate isomerase [Melioribacteraceae bacterium]